VDGNLYLTEKHEGSVTGEVIRTGKAVALADASADARSAQPTVRAGGVPPLAVLEDRERIATELHDGAIQSLFAVGMACRARGPGHHPRPTRPLSQPGATGTMRS
jgi:signal transduction histidine kinase